MHKTSAWPLALAYTALIVYASLYPFDAWRDQGFVPWAYLWQPLPKYWTWFDVATNVAGYFPYGFLLAVSALRTGRTRYAVLLASVTVAAVSLALETTQSYLPTRVASNVDFALNALGGFVGAFTAAQLERAGALARWSRLRKRWFVPDARGALVLLALWPAALLFPSEVPLGLGQVMERLEAWVAELLTGTPFLAWLPVRDIELQPMVPGVEAICVMLGGLIPCCLGFCVITSRLRRGAFAAGVLGLGVATTALSGALSFGPAHLWGWLNLPVQVGLVAAGLLALPMALLPRRVSAAVMLLAIGVYLSLLNQATQGPYFAQTLNAWEQGQFIRFNGLAQWLAWLWPYGALLYGLLMVGQRETSG